MYYEEIFYHFVNKIARHGLTIKVKVQRCNSVRTLVHKKWSSSFVCSWEYITRVSGRMNYGQNTIFMTLTSQLVQ